MFWLARRSTDDWQGLGKRMELDSDNCDPQLEGYSYVNLFLAMTLRTRPRQSSEALPRVPEIPFTRPDRCRVPPRSSSRKSAAVAGMLRFGAKRQDSGRGTCGLVPIGGSWSTKPRHHLSAGAGDGLARDADVVGASGMGQQGCQHLSLERGLCVAPPDDGCPVAQRQPH